MHTSKPHIAWLTFQSKHKACEWHALMLFNIWCSFFQTKMYVYVCMCGYTFVCVHMYTYPQIHTCIQIQMYGQEFFCWGEG
eukprot:c44119_g1_i1 orf=673-915(+)